MESVQFSKLFEMRRLAKLVTFVTLKKQLFLINTFGSNQMYFYTKVYISNVTSVTKHNIL